jgi:uncharacterized membrane protein YozB (DUF420 family)
MTEIHIALAIIGAVIILFTLAITFFLLLQEHRKDVRYKKQKEWLNKK